MFGCTFKVFRYYIIYISIWILLRVLFPAHLGLGTIKCFKMLQKIFCKIFLGESILRGRVEMTHFEDLDILERSLKNPIKVPVHEVTGMKTAEDNYGAFISMTPGQPY